MDDLGGMELNLFNEVLDDEVIDSTDDEIEDSDTEETNSTPEERDESIIENWRTTGLNKRKSDDYNEKCDDSKRSRNDELEGDPKKENEDPGLTQEPASCSVCLEDIDGGGDHRLVALRCGHPFGQSCVQRWLQDQKSCPMCNSAARPEDIRVVFLDRYKLGSSFDLAEANKQVAVVSHARDAALRTAEKLKSELNALKTENSILRNRVTHLEKYGLAMYEQAAKAAFPGEFPRNQSFTPLNGGCKYMAYSERLGMIGVSTKTQSGPFMGFAVELCSMFDLKSRSIKMLHKAEIKDLGFHAERPWLLTVSLDNSIKISEVNQLSLSPVHTLNLPTKVWSCSWSQKRDTTFYAGLQTGNVNEYDIRNLSGPVVWIGASENRRPVVSLRSFMTDASNSGFLCSELRSSVRLYREHSPGFYDAHSIPAQGNCFSVASQRKSGTIMISTRIPRGVMNELFTIQFGSDNAPIISPSCKFSSGGRATVLAKPTLCQSPDNKLWACCIDDAEKAIQVFSGETAHCLHSLKTRDPSLAQFSQVEQVSLPGQSPYSIVGLSDNGLSFYS